MTEFFFDLPIWLVEIVAMAVAVGIGVGLHSLVQRAVPYTKLAKHNDVAGFLFSMVGVIYAVVLGFVVIVVWEKHDSAVANALNEESAVSDMYRLTAAFPVAARTHIRNEIRDYAQAMVSQEWPAMMDGSESHAAQLKGEDLALTVETFKPRTQAESNVHAATLVLLQRFLDARRERLRQNEGTVLPILWYTLLIGGLATVSFTYFFGTENKRMQLAMTAIISVLLATMFVMIGEFDRPFSGSVRVPSTIWTTFLNARIHEIR